MSTLYTTQTYFFLCSSLFSKWGGGSITGLCAFKYHLQPKTLCNPIYHRLVHLGTVQPNQQLDAKTPNPAESIHH